MDYSDAVTELHLIYFTIKNIMKYYHFCTEGLRKGIIFRDEEDFIVGMNYVAITAKECGLVILAFCLMSNHWHFIVRGNTIDIERFNTLLKSRISMWLHRKYSLSHFLKGQELTIKEIDSLDYLRKVIGYVLRNPIVAGINCTVESYRWGSGKCYFHENHPHDKQVISDRSKGILCKTNSSAIKSYGLDRYGMITPDQYVDKEAVTDIFRTAKAFIYNVMSFKSFDMDLELENGLAQKIAIEDGKLIKIVESLCSRDFKVRSADLLPTRDKCIVAVKLRKDYGASSKQISRILGLDQDVIELLR